MDINWTTESRLKAAKKYPGLESSIYYQKPAIRSLSTPIQGSIPLDQNQVLSFELEARPLEEYPFLREPTKTLAELERDIIAKGPPGQWFRKIPGKKTDITWPKATMQPPSEKPKILIHRLLQGGNFAFRQIPGTQCSVELMSTYFPVHPNEPPRRFKLANLSFLNDPIAIYTSTAFRARRDVPFVTVVFNASPLRNEFMLKIGGSFSTANTTNIVTPTLPTPFPSGPLLPTLFGRALSSPHARIAFSQGLRYYRPWDLGTFLLAIMGRLESPHHWYEDSSLEQNERWNGKDAWEKWRTGVDVDGDWDMVNGFRSPLTISQIVVKERELLAQYQGKGFWYMREWGKDSKIDEMHVALTPVSDWVWEICY
ncbi:hypothetical protein TWF191_004897 [Orbilia oligospora]|uniref:Uncharacterized protein n=1 Tax=Orbilia oligospora TaxID=2813651 RepID=A0A7C8QU60_ORBOL|nr:hypothetical protein TWF191_004897 [Orbilia oligospora]